MFPSDVYVLLAARTLWYRCILARLFTTFVKHTSCWARCRLSHWRKETRPGRFLCLPWNTFVLARGVTNAINIATTSCCGVGQAPKQPPTKLSHPCVLLCVLAPTLSTTMGNHVPSVLRYNIYTYEGSDAPWVTNSGRSQRNQFKRNTIIGGDEAIKLGSADFTRFNGNTFQDASKIRFQDSTKTVMKNNKGLDDVEMRITEACFHGVSDAAFAPIC